MKHTTGPWRFTNDDQITCTVMDATGELIVARTAIPEDAQLIAAAPELLEMLDVLIRITTNSVDPSKFYEIRNKAEDLLMRAGGHYVNHSNTFPPIIMVRETLSDAMARGDAYRRAQAKGCVTVTFHDEQDRLDWTGKVQYEDREEGS